MVDPAAFDVSRRQRAAVIAASVAGWDSRAMPGFAAGPQRKLAGFLDKLLHGARGKVAGLAGDLSAELAAEIGLMDLAAVRREVEGRPGLLHRVPLVGRYVSAVRRLRAVQAQVAARSAAIEARASARLAEMRADRVMWGRLVDATEDTLRELEVWVAGGQQALLRLREAFAAAQQGPHAGDAELREMAERIDAFEARLVRIDVLFTQGTLAVPQLRAGQGTGPDVVEEALEAVVAELPELRAAVAGVVGKAEDVRRLTGVADRVLAAVARGTEAEQEGRVTREEVVQLLGELQACSMAAMGL